MFPAGPLRENLKEIKNYDLIFLNGEKKNKKLLSKLRSIDKNLKIFQGIYKPLNLKNFAFYGNEVIIDDIDNSYENNKTLNYVYTMSISYPIPFVLYNQCILCNKHVYRDPISAIYTPFSIILIYEIYLLIVFQLHLSLIYLLYETHLL
jgi:hypothetical protein